MERQLTILKIYHCSSNFTWLWWGFGIMLINYRYAWLGIPQEKRGCELGFLCVYFLQLQAHWEQSMLGDWWRGKEHSRQVVGKDLNSRLFYTVGWDSPFKLLLERQRQGDNHIPYFRCLVLSSKAKTIVI